jgi:hypothetical protein
MTESERIRRVSSLGYTEREAEFLCRAALHAGYFVRRQFLMFAERERGRADTALTDKAIAARHVKKLVFRHKRTVYSFCSKPFFAALGHPENRNRRTHEIPTIKSRLIGFDYVLSNPALDYLPTEAEKVEFFQERCRIGVEHLPSKRYQAKESNGWTERYFVDKFPVGTERGIDGEQHVVFTYVDDGDHSTSGFENYLEQYRGLFMRLSRFRLVYVSVTREHFHAAERLFQAHVSTSDTRQAFDPAGSRLLQHFRDRDAYERKDLTRFDQRKLIQFREDRRAFAGPENDRLFDCWRERGEPAVVRQIAPDYSAGSRSRGSFSTWLSSFRYELFGTITSGYWRGES